MTNSAHFPLIQGSIPAIVTPMFADGRLDIESFQRVLDWHLEEGTNGFVVVGTSGESATLSVSEHVKMIEVAVAHVGKRVPVIAGAGGNSTDEAISLTGYAKEAGAIAALQVVPYYNKPTQEGMFQHFKAISEAVDLPIILYNVPGRTVANMSNETILRLAALPGIIGVKDATGDLNRGIRLINDVPEGFAVYSGDDATATALMLFGGAGNISVTANVAPRLMSQLCAAAMQGDVLLARQIHSKVLMLHQQLFVESNPIPVKWALYQMKKIETGIRLPLTPLDEPFHEQVLSAMKQAEVI